MCCVLDTVLNSLLPCSTSSLFSASLVVGTETLLVAGHVTIYPSKTAGWVGTQVHLVERTIKYPTLPADFSKKPDSGWSRDQPQPRSLFQRLREAEKRDPGNEVDCVFPFSRIIWMTSRWQKQGNAGYVLMSPIDSLEIEFYF